jgi:glycosyltransferase involved in cell wall biosynthesis
LLVGDGPERARLEQLATSRGVRAVFTGTVSHDELPDYLAAMDVAVVLAAAGQPFHYSPLKLAEYLAAGLPVIAPRAGGLASQLRDGVDAVLVAPGDPVDLANALGRLRADPAVRGRLAATARATAQDRWLWDRSVATLLAAVEAVRDRPRPAR